MRRFLQHVLPKGLHKIRYFGLWHPAKRKDAARARLCFFSTGRRRNLAAGSARTPLIHRPTRKRRTIRGLSLLPQRPSNVRPPALPEVGPRTMTCNSVARYDRQVHACLGHAAHPFGPPPPNSRSVSAKRSPLAPSPQFPSAQLRPRRSPEPSTCSPSSPPTPDPD